MNQIITPAHIEKGISYSKYQALINARLAENKTTGHNQSEALLEYTTLNKRRMCRLDRTIQLLPETLDAFLQLELDMYWVVLTEAWCGDAAQIVPVIARMAELAPRIELKLLLRDDNPEVMDAFLTNGGRAIPKLICVDTSRLKVLWHWGPRPQPAQDIMNRFKENPSGSKHVVLKQIQLWYSSDRGQTIQREIIRFL